VITIGPVIYQQVDGFTQAVSFNTRAQSQTTEGTALIIRSNFKRLTKDLSDLIDLPGFGLANGQRVVCTEQPMNQFELKDGRVIAVVDSSSEF
jgi:GTP-binding protein EngB required for normal cell division